MPRRSVVIALVVIVLGIVFGVIGNAGFFPPAQAIRDPNYRITNTQETLTDFGGTGGQPAFTEYSIKVEIDSSGPHDIIFRAELSQNYQGVAAGTELFRQPYYGAGSGTYTFTGYYAAPFGGQVPSGIPVKYTIQLSGTSSPTYQVTQYLKNRFFGVFGLPVFLIGLILLGIAFLTRPKKQPVGPTPVIISPTLGAYGYSGAGTGVAGVGIQQKPAKKAGGLRPAKKVKRPAARPVARAGSAPCPYCGKLVPGGAYYCPSCYSKVK
ncbi:MAG: hypothetical protein ACFFD4_23365 [Candidatus Odinarchaeota archaeon]